LKNHNDYIGFEERDMEVVMEQVIEQI